MTFHFARNSTIVQILRRNNGIDKINAFHRYFLKDFTWQISTGKCSQQSPASFHISKKHSDAFALVKIFFGCVTTKVLIAEAIKLAVNNLLEMPDTREVFENDLLSLVEHCKKLWYLKISAFVSTRFLDRLLQLRSERRCNLSVIKVML